MEAAMTEELPRYDLTLAGLADNPDAFWLAQGLERLTQWVAAVTDPQQRRERVGYANAVLEDLSATAPGPRTVDRGGDTPAMTRAGAHDR
jgi:hypothetical protein